MTDLDLRQPYDVALPLDAPITAGTARKGDPAASKIAAKNTKPGKAHKAILEAFTEADGVGTLDTACDAVPNLLRGSVSRRLSDLEQMTPARLRRTDRMVDGRHGMKIHVWEVVS